MTVFLWYALGDQQFDELFPLVLFDVNSLKFLPSLVVKDQLRRLAGNLLKDGSLELGLKVPVDEVLHLGELIQSSSGAGLDNTSIHGVVLKLYPVLPLSL